MKRIIPLICLLLAGYLPVRAQIGGMVEVNVNELYFGCAKLVQYTVPQWYSAGPFLPVFSTGTVPSWHNQ